jgi:hypothetical protein
MSYSQLSQPAAGAGETLPARMDALEALQVAKQVASLSGTHFYAGDAVPTAFTGYGTDTAGIATQVWVSEVRIHGNSLITGISFLTGSVAGTDSVIVILYDANGNVVANSALAGTTVTSSTTAFQRVPFTTPYQAAPGLYYIGVSTNGTHAKIQTQPAGDHNAGIITAQTFGTLVAITPPTTFTASKGPVAMTY